MHSWMLFALLSAFFAALVAIFGKLGLKGVDTTLATAIRGVIMAVFLVVVAFALGKVHFGEALTGRTLLFIVLSGIAGALSWLAYFTALKLGPASGVAALDRLSVVFVFIAATLFLAEAFTWKHLLGAALVSLGAVLLI